ncbi:MAG TPA: LysE family transporter [Tenuifilaceae bacterium]|nr:LysE family transporter [Tenuifilaceae bacterium]HPE17540.1 LysE family transporter [Tenuifilaceae bacterium]HPJ45784.1 LysE family transporter [Tenuifilaceae bacterium]HPQ34012.1 LysE family transporter [Tenuifilaceae bacterium]HRX68171.1 LysE family transporter [Tenuifilaceae bacterium]
MQLWATLLVKGILIGLLASIPLGPIGVICIQRTINKGRLSGFISGLGAASADTIFATIAGFSLTFIISFIEEKQIAFQAIGGIVVVALGAKIFFTNPIRQLRRHKRKKNSLTEDFISVLLLTITNPLAVFFFLALFAAFGVVSGQTTWFLSLITLGGVFLGAGLWWYALTSLVNLLRNKFRLKQLWWINKISGITIFILGIFALVGVFVLL